MGLSEKESLPQGFGVLVGPRVVYTKGRLALIFSPCQCNERFHGALNIFLDNLLEEPFGEVCIFMNRYCGNPSVWVLHMAVCPFNPNNLKAVFL